jgi:hypothetical protein
MECPHCKEKLESITCPGCSKEVPDYSLYCLFCGMRLDGESVQQAPFEEDTPEGYGDDPDFENRILCPDGTCTGIIENGRCTECGKPYDRSGETPSDQEQASTGNRE